MDPSADGPHPEDERRPVRDLTGPRESAEARPPSWSLRVGSVAGIPIRIHFTFWLLLIWVGWMARVNGQTALFQVGVIVGLFACIVLHELGHALVAKGFGIKTRDITLYPIGGISSLQSMGKPAQELWISLAGPAVNVALAGVLWAVLAGTGNSVTPEAVAAGRLSFLQWLFVGNVVLALFNVVPAFPMDGGRLLRAVLALRIGVARATQIAATVGQGLAVLMGLTGLLSGNFMLMFVALFVFLGASGEAETQRTIASTTGYHMRDAMITRFETVSHGDTLEVVVERLLRTNQEDFPVVHGERVLGILTRRQLLSALAVEGKEGLVAGAMSRDFLRVDPGQDLTKALELLRGAAAAPLLVFEKDRLVGMVTLDNLVEFLSVARAGAVPAPAS